MIAFARGGFVDRFCRQKRAPTGVEGHVGGDRGGWHALGNMLFSDKLMSHVHRGRTVLGVDGGDPGGMARRRRTCNIAHHCQSGGRHAVLCRRGGLEHGKLTGRIRVVY